VLAYGPSDSARADRVVAALAGWGVVVTPRKWTTVYPPDPLSLDACAVYAALLSKTSLGDVPESSLVGEWSSVQLRQEAQDGSPFAVVMILLDAEAKERQRQPSSRDWPAWSKARTMSLPPSDSAMIDFIARSLFDAGRLPRPAGRVSLYCVTASAAEDVNARGELYKHLRGLPFVDSTDSTAVLAGAPEDAWKGLLESAQIIVLLVTPDLLAVAGDPARPGEVELAVARHRDKKALVVPLLVRSLYGWRDSLEANGAPRLDAIPRDDDDFLGGRSNQDAAWSEAVRELAFRIQLHCLRNLAPVGAVAQ
jgi:hypothetical protein